MGRINNWIEYNKIVLAEEAIDSNMYHRRFDFQKNKLNERN
jgi:hypothetical protein